MTASKKLAAAALAGLFTAGVMAAAPAFAAEEKAACSGKDKAAHEKAACKGEKGKEAAHCNGKEADGKSHCAGKDGDKKDEKK